MQIIILKMFPVIIKTIEFIYKIMRINNKRLFLKLANNSKKKKNLGKF